MKLELKDEDLYPLFTEDVDGKPYLTTWVGNYKEKWFYAVRKGDCFSRPYWDAPMKDHVTLIVFDTKEEAKNYMISNLQEGIYLSCGWIKGSLKTE